MKVCKVEGCNKTLLAKGLCSAHYYRNKRNGSPEQLKNRKRDGSCSIDGCKNEIKAKGLCGKHYKRFYKYGDVTVVNPRRAKPIEFVVDGNGCFNCTSHYRCDFGYAYTGENGKIFPVYRKVYREMFGEIPKGQVVRHKCDNPQCINPEHLELGTPRDNAMDRVKRGRVPKGELVKTSKLKEHEVKDIIRLLDFGKSPTELGELYKVSASTIRDIKYSKTWVHIERS